jgi:hypothetical protein
MRRPAKIAAVAKKKPSKKDASKPKKHAAKPKKNAATPQKDAAKSKKKDLAKLAAKAEAALEKKKKQLDAEVDLIRDRLEDIEDAFYDIAKALGRIEDKELWRAVPGCESTAGLCEKLGLFGRETARKLLAIHAHRVSRRVAIDLGVSRTFQLARYTEASEAHDTVEGLVEANAIIGKKRVLASTSEELREAADGASRESGQRKAHESRAETEREAENAVRKVRRCLRDLGATGADVDARITRTSFEVLVRLTPEQCDRIEES